MSARKPQKIRLPKSWTAHVRSAVLHVISLAQYATVYTRSWAANSRNARVRLKAENVRLQQEVALLREEIRVKDTRMLCESVPISDPIIQRSSAWRSSNCERPAAGPCSKPQRRFW